MGMYINTTLVRSGEEINFLATCDLASTWLDKLYYVLK